MRIRTNTTLDQDCNLEATVQLCTACMIVSLLTTCMNFNNSILSRRLQNNPQDAWIREIMDISLEPRPLDTKLSKHVTPETSIPKLGLYSSPATWRSSTAWYNCMLTIPDRSQATILFSRLGDFLASTAWSRQSVCSLMSWQSLRSLGLILQINKYRHVNLHV